MSQVNVCLELAADIASGRDQNLLEANYQKIFKKALTFLYSHPDFYLSISFTGPQLEFYDKKHPESIELLKDLLSRKQIEIVGGGYYAPVFPLIYPADRTGQIEKMSVAIRSILGKRPVGMYLFGSIWDPMLVMTFYSSGMNYIFLDSTLIPQKNLKCLPLIASEQGKSIKVLPTFKNLIPEEKETKKDWTKRVVKFYEKNRMKGGSEGNEETDKPLLSVSIDFESFGLLLDCGFFGELFDFNLDSTLQEKNLEFLLPANYLQNAVDYVPSYIPAGMEWNIAQWASVPFERTENNSHFPLTIYDFLNTYPQNSRLYERMMYISMLIFQCKGGDRMRKLSATQNLWIAQSGTNFVSYPLGVPAVAEKRQGAYRLLNEAEYYVRDASKQFKESLTVFDYNGDGLDEYVAYMEHYNSVLALKGGKICDFNLLKASANYASSLSGIREFDGFSDGYDRGLFVEHLGENSHLKSYLETNRIETPLFSKVQFKEKKFENKRREITLEGKGYFSEKKLPVTLRKKITFLSVGITVQYILKNESDVDLTGFFAVELSFPQTRFDAAYSKGEQYSLEIVHNEEKKSFDSKKKFSFVDSVSIVQLKDEADKRIFVIEPNEESGFVCSLLGFKRPCNSIEPEEISKTLVASLFWDINLSPSMEKEKTIFFSIVPVKK